MAKHGRTHDLRLRHSARCQQLTQSRETIGWGHGSRLWKAGLVVAAVSREPAVLETVRLLLVALDCSLVEQLTAIYADPEVARYIGADRLTAERTREQVGAFEQVWREHGYGQSALLERATGRMIGRAGLHPWPNWDELEVGYVLARDRWGRGLAREASQVWLHGRGPTCRTTISSPSSSRPTLRVSRWPSGSDSPSTAMTSPPAARTCRSTDSTTRRPEEVDTPATRPFRRCE